MDKHNNLGSYFRAPFPLFFAKAFAQQKNELHSARAAIVWRSKKLQQL